MGAGADLPRAGPFPPASHPTFPTHPSSPTPRQVLDLSGDAAAHQQKLAETARLLSDHPALLVWEGPDELLWNNWWVTMEPVATLLKTGILASW